MPSWATRPLHTQRAPRWRTIVEDVPFWVEVGGGVRGGGCGVDWRDISYAYPFRALCFLGSLGKWAVNGSWPKTRYSCSRHWLASDISAGNQTPLRLSLECSPCLGRLYHNSRGTFIDVLPFPCSPCLGRLYHNSRGTLSYKTQTVSHLTVYRDYKTDWRKTPTQTIKHRLAHILQCTGTIQIVSYLTVYRDYNTQIVSYLTVYRDYTDCLISYSVQGL